MYFEHNPHWRHQMKITKQQLMRIIKEELAKTNEWQAFAKDEEEPIPDDDDLDKEGEEYGAGWRFAKMEKWNDTGALPPENASVHWEAGYKAWQDNASGNIYEENVVQSVIEKLANSNK